MNKRFFYVFLALFIPLMLHNVFLLFNGTYKKHLEVDKEGERIYKEVTNTIYEMDGKIVSMVGKISRGFAIDIKFLNKNMYQQSKLFSTIDLLGFSYKEKSFGTYLFCKKNSGILVGEKDYSSISIRYTYKDEDCRN